MQEPVQIQQSTIDNAALTSVERRLAALEQAPTTVLPTDQALASWAAQAARVSLTHQEMAALADQTVATCDAAAKGAEERLSQLDETQQAMLSTVSEAVSEAQEGVAAAVQSLQQQGAATLSEVEEAALVSAQQVARSEAARVAREVAGTFYPASSTIAPEDPRNTDARSWCLKHWGIERDYIQGDSVLLTRESGIIPLIYKGPSLGWIEGAELEPRVITATGPVISDQSTKSEIFISNDIKFPGGGGGGVSLPPLVREVTLGVPRWVEVFKTYDCDVPTKFYGGLPGTDSYDTASWNLHPTETHSWRVSLVLVSTTIPGDSVAVTFTVLRDGRGALSFAPHDSTASGYFQLRGLVGVADVKIDEFTQDFTAESGGKVGQVHGETLSFWFTDYSQTPATFLLSGHAMPIKRRRAGV
jgi:hypothetical protein